MLTNVDVMAQVRNAFLWVEYDHHTIKSSCLTTLFILLHIFIKSTVPWKYVQYRTD